MRNLYLHFWYEFIFPCLDMYKMISIQYSWLCLHLKCSTLMMKEEKNRFHCPGQDDLLSLCSKAEWFTIIKSVIEVLMILTLTNADFCAIDERKLSLGLTQYHCPTALFIIYSFLMVGFKQGLLLFHTQFNPANYIKTIQGSWIMIFFWIFTSGIQILIYYKTHCFGAVSEPVSV